MYLKSIEVQGFKSFANKLNFEFHNGVTCIVGPNGSGKSNVADAVRWVLGEQSAKQLRGANMQDVIFAGTELRKPQGYAYVAITLDNSDHVLPSDYEEITVSRRVYRSGDSEYRINGASVRLRDIQELFYDTGIGKEGYSIIGQGQIDKILSNKPDERRELFDEAVGIVKFKRRKRETLKRLDSEHENLVRVTDIINELEKQVGPLARQSENAKKYLAYRDELKGLDLSLFTLEYDKNAKELEEIEKNTEIVNGHIEEVKKEGEELVHKYEDVNNRMARLENDIEEGNAMFNDLSVSIQEAEGRIAVLGEQINTENTNLLHLGERYDDACAAEKKAKDEQKELEKTVRDNAERERSLINDEYDAENTLAALDIRIAKHQKSVEESKAKLMNLLSEKTGAASKLSRFEGLEQQLLLRKGEISSRALRLKSESQTLAQELSTQKQDQEDLSRRIDSGRKKYLEVSDKRKKTDAELKELNEKRGALSQEYRLSLSKAESLKNLEERYEGYPVGVKRIMERGGRGICGVVGNLIKAGQGYETAIEIALGGAINNIVTDDTQTAKRLIGYLKDNNLGRATFLPLDAFGSRQGTAEAVKDTGFLGIASELVEYGGKYEGAIVSLLGRTLVFDNMDNAAAAAKRPGYKLRIVTLDGELLAPGGSLTGGRFKNTGNLLGRKNEIEALESTASQAKKDLDAAELKATRLENLLLSLTREEKDLSDSIQKLILEKNTVDMRISGIRESSERTDAEYALVSSESSDIDKEIAQLRAQKADVSTDLASIESRNSDSEKNISDDEEKLAQEKDRREQLALKLTSVRIELANIKQKKEFAADSAIRIKSDMDQACADKETLLTRTASTNEAIAAIKEQICALESEKAEKQRQKEEVAEKVKNDSYERSVIMSDQKEFFAKQQDITGRQKDLELEIIRLTNRREKIDEQMDAKTAYLWEEYELTPTEALVPTDTITLSVAELRKQTGSIKNAIKALGNVNVNAIEDYKEVSGRYEFMKGQYDDLTKAEENLKNIIAELDTGMRAQFNSQFARIQEEFDKVFGELFGGGHGRLELVEDEDVIEAGIRIISQPPGKKLQNMMQLSGGEKALTAIALLFAIQNLKPSPFCLLDEIEAALDDSNVGRFAGYLHRLTDRTQFILISHRRGTMVMADRLYGITMQEKGVSALVSVNLIESELDN